MTREVLVVAEDEEYALEVADTILTRAWGLSLRKEGRMLFKFSKPVKTGIDMMLLSKPLHLYFLDEECKVIEIQKAQPWSFNPKTWKLYRPEKPYQYLIESFKPLNIEKDQKIEIKQK